MIGQPILLKQFTGILINILSFDWRFYKFYENKLAVSGGRFTLKLRTTVHQKFETRGFIIS
jgi:hypothetical protein